MMSDSLVGQKVGGYEVLKELRRGGMSTIYLARQSSIGREVVLKTLSPLLLGDPTFMERFTREVATTARLQHPHIIPVYDYGQIGERPYVVMAYIPGGSLEDLLAEGALPLDTTVRILGQVAQALDFAHGFGVIHRDVKPANILLDSQQNAILTDFGIAKVIAETQELTGEALVGTPSFLAPELVDLKNPVTPAADVYALGVTAYRMLAGVLPFPGRSAAELLWAHVNEPAPLIGPLRPDLPAGVDAVLQKALAKTPAARYVTASEMATDLAEVAAGHPPALAEQSPAQPAGQTGPLLPTHDLQQAVQRIIEYVVKISRPDGGVGSGVYLPHDRVLTCLHVVDGAAGLYVRFRNGEQMEADVVATDPLLDLAMLKLRTTPTAWSAAQGGGISFEFDPLEPGDTLVAIGHPLGLDWSVTGGHYNALRYPGEQPLPRFGIALNVPLVQVDVSINPGNSGGPIVNTAGELVGLADSIIDPAVANNIGFAIHGPAVWRFWQEHQADEEALTAYSCGHHHRAGEAYCPLTGKPAKPVEPVPMPSVDSVLYSCGHLHPPDLTYCPLLGKPAYPVSEPATDTRPSLPTEAEPPVKCTNCGHTYSARLSACPACGKPRRK
jgi:serine/threonine-protein kinase